MSQSITTYYETQIAEADEEIRKFGKLVNTYSFLRLFSILLGGFITYQTLKLENIFLTELTFLTAVVGFAFMVRQQARFEKKKLFFIAFKEVCQNEIVSIESQGNIYSNGSAYINEGHQYTSDLDVFGPSSLFNLINRCATPVGNEMLSTWMAHASLASEIHLRQEAVRELSSKKQWVLEFQALLLFARTTTIKDIENLFTYLKMDFKANHQLLAAYVRFVPIAILSFAVGAWYIPSLTPIPILLIFINGILVYSKKLDVNTTDYFLSTVGKTLSAYAQSFKKIESENWSSSLCEMLREKFIAADKPISAELKKLGAITGKLEYRLNMLIGAFLNGIFAWDVRQFLAIEKWKAENRDIMQQAFEAIASFEALVSLTSLHTNYQDWCFPEIAGNENYTYKASKLSHPLIPASSRVDNDYQLENEHRIDLITGSNMAGKSTFLRTLGANAVLAFAGAPVCAAQMEITVMNLFAYMRIRDSLNESISTFKAELNRLQLLFDVLSNQSKVFFLVDEMLRGTNSVDKYRGSNAVIEKLVAQRAVGVVATHDLQLAELEKKYPAYIRNFYFDIKVLEGEMLFDYKLKRGECKTFNASLLLKKIGIDIDL